MTLGSVSSPNFRTCQSSTENSLESQATHALLLSGVVLVWEGALIMLAQCGGGGVLYPCPTGHGCRAPGPGEATGRQLGPLCEALSELPRSPQIGSEGAKDSEGLVRGVRRRDFSSHQHIFSFLHLFYFVHLERKTSLTASEHRIILEAGAAMGDRDRLKKPTFQDHIETGAPWALLRKWNCQKPRPQASEPREVSGETQAC